MEIDTETALFYGFIALLLIVISTVILLLIHSGFFSEIIVQTGKPIIGEIRIAYKSAKGPYKESCSIFTEVHTLLPQYRTIGVYYDDPRKNEPSRLRYIVGLILSENGGPVNEDDEQKLKEWNYKFATFPSVNHAVQTSFPFKSTISIVVGIFRVYPILNEYIELRSLCVHPFIEIYDSEKRNIFFIGPLEQQDSFYVPEILETEEENVQADDDDDRSSVSWDDSASIIKSEELDSDSIPDDNQPLTPSIDESQLSKELGTAHSLESERILNLAEETTSKSPVPVDGESVCDKLKPDEDSDNNTASSFEEIDEKDAPESKEEKCPPEEQKSEL